MADITTITSILGSVKAAAEIAKLIKDSDFGLEKAEIKLKFADLMSKLADARIELADVQELLLEKEKRIKELEEAFNKKEQIVRVRDAFYELDEKGNPAGEPYCMNCWQVHKKAYALHVVAGDRHSKVCPACKTQYSGRMTETIYPTRVESA